MIHDDALEVVEANVREQHAADNIIDRHGQPQNLEVFLLMQHDNLHIFKNFNMDGSRCAQGRKISVQPDNRTKLIEAEYRPDRILTSTISDDRLFSELGYQYNGKLSKLFLQNRMKRFYFFFNIKMRKLLTVVEQ